MIETTATLIMIVSEGVRIPREVHTLLTRNGYAVVEVRCGEDALLKLREERPNLILSISMWRQEDVNATG